MDDWKKCDTKISSKSNIGKIELDIKDVLVQCGIPSRGWKEYLEKHKMRYLNLEGVVIKNFGDEI
ncbi:hypothetical protein BK138_35180 [Paenibacillus rhizosphaerae]|uniref:Uncharacterized protein n=1 Tax=Paenibacillus rhizosphaerae TaxID=297318 RepID=A0A1R1DWV0_9BACL|nr:hypothetical protein [Paenibacillus rhizosphaerae]OMF44006.1 hypothetical protein BK138_35180 [Paenibacillus rhizosphaerae]